MKAPTHDNDNSETWIELAAATANLVRYLENPQDHQRNRERHTPDQRTEEEKANEHRKAVEEGLRHIERFESRYRRADRS